MNKIIKIVLISVTLSFQVTGCLPSNFIRPTLNSNAANVKILSTAPRRCQYKGEIVGMVIHVTDFDPLKMKQKIAKDKIIRVKNLTLEMGGNRAVILRAHTEARQIFEVYSVYRCKR